jgi:hypothetical protein
VSLEQLFGSTQTLLHLPELHWLSVVHEAEFGSAATHMPS